MQWGMIFSYFRSWISGMTLFSSSSVMNPRCFARAAELEMPAVALTDHGSLAGAVELAHEIAVSAAFSKPKYLTRAEVPQEAAAEERATLEGITRAEGKPEAAMGKIVEGRMNGWFKERVLLEQPYVKDDKQTIAQLLGDATLVRFALVAIGA